MKHAIRKLLIALLAFAVIVLYAAIAHGETNQPTLTDTSAREAANYLDKLVQFNDKLLGLPALPLVIVSCIAFCYLLKAMPFVPNKWIPFWNFVLGVGGYSGLTLATLNMNAPKNIIIAALVKNALIGMIGSISAWLIHSRVLKKLEKRFGFESETEIFTRPPDPKP